MRRNSKNGDTHNDGMWIGNFCRQLFFRPLQPNTISAMSYTHKCGSCTFDSTCKIPLKIHNQRSRSCSYGKSSRTKMMRFRDTSMLATSQQVRPSGDCMDLKSTASTNLLKSCRAIYKINKPYCFNLKRFHSF